MAARSHSFDSSMRAWSARSIPSYGMTGYDESFEESSLLVLNACSIRPSERKILVKRAAPRFLLR